MSCPTHTPVSLNTSVYRQPHADKGASRLHTRRVEANVDVVGRTATRAPDPAVYAAQAASCTSLPASTNSAPLCHNSGASAPADLRVSLVFVTPGFGELRGSDQVLTLLARKNKGVPRALLVYLG